MEVAKRGRLFIKGGLKIDRDGQCSSEAGQVCVSYIENNKDVIFIYEI
jgi:hypothetical protein